MVIIRGRLRGLGVTVSYYPRAMSNLVQVISSRGGTINNEHLANALSAMFLLKLFPAFPNTFHCPPKTKS